MSTLEIIGLVHVIVYAVLGGAAAVVILGGFALDWIIKRAKLTGDVVRCYAKVLQERGN